MKGLVIKNTGSWYLVRTDENEEVNCKVKGKFRLKGIRTTNPVAVGDRVTIAVNPDGNAYITEIEPRKNYIIRRASNLSKESHIIAANVDRAYLVVTLSHPTTSLTFIDRFLATAEAYEVPVTVVINKIDLLHDAEDKELLDAVAYLYRSIGYTVIEVSATEGTGIELLKEKLTGQVSLFSGNSGVGKSTLINDIIPEAELRTASISESHDTGMHTTTFSEMFELPEGGWIIDTPGIKGFGTIDFKKEEIGHFFPEIFKTAQECRYSDCTHTGEPGCAVVEAVEDHRIAESRFNSYLSVLQDTNPDKYRKPF